MENNPWSELGQKPAAVCFSRLQLIRIEADFETATGGVFLVFCDANPDGAPVFVDEDNEHDALKLHVSEQAGFQLAEYYILSITRDVKP